MKSKAEYAEQLARGVRGERGSGEGGAVRGKGGSAVARRVARRKEEWEVRLAGVSGGE